MTTCTAHGLHALCSCEITMHQHMSPGTHTSTPTHTTTRQPTCTDETAAPRPPQTPQHNRSSSQQQPTLSQQHSCNKKHVTVAHMLFESYSTITTLRHPCKDRTPAVQHQAPQTFPNPRRCMPPQTTALQSPEQLVALLLPLSLPCSPMSPPTKTSQTPCSHAVTCCDTL